MTKEEISAAIVRHCLENSKQMVSEEIKK